MMFNFALASIASSNEKMYEKKSESTVDDFIRRNYTNDCSGLNVKVNKSRTKVKVSFIDAFGNRIVNKFLI